MSPKSTCRPELVATRNHAILRPFSETERGCPKRSSRHIPGAGAVRIRRAAPEQAKEEAAVQTIGRDTLRHWQERKRHFALVKVLAPDRYREFHLPGAINVPVGEDFEARIQEAVPARPRRSWFTVTT